jgi:hypothetical protein
MLKKILIGLAVLIALFLVVVALPQMQSLLETKAQG